VSTESDPRSEERWGPEDAAPFVQGDEERPGSMPPDADPGAEPTPGTSEALDPVEGLHRPEIDERGERQS
jgi:hypothetical protein